MKFFSGFGHHADAVFADHENIIEIKQSATKIHPFFNQSLQSITRFTIEPLPLFACKTVVQWYRKFDFWSSALFLCPYLFTDFW